MEALRYRGEDIERSITKAVVKEARAKELRLELLNSKRLKAFFEEHPGELGLSAVDHHCHDDDDNNNNNCCNNNNNNNSSNKNDDHNNNGFNNNK